ncbi:MAG: type II secretion system F family protein [Thermoguttaceae bacterium]|jgi:general secretion pathway protein F/type IV pilus assembly protein PilC|nr:type II secretion system F family protein [Thermoguttaceae bacterium]
MPEFIYTARNPSGQDVVGTITASGKRESLAALAERDLFPLRVEPVRARARAWQPRRKIKSQAVATNLQQLADLLQNGVPLLKSLDILAAQATPRELGEVLADVRDQVAEGTPLDEAFARHPRVFGELTVSMVRAGAEGAFLEDALKRTADFLELQEELKWRVVGAMTYPAILAVAGALVTVVLIVFFVPKFAALFARLEQQGGGLPWATVALLSLSGFLARYGLYVAGALAGVGVWLKGAIKTERGRRIADAWKLKIPVAGNIFLNSAVSRFCRVLGTLLRNGVPLLRAMEISSESAGNKLLARAIRASAENISSGETLAKPLAQCGLIPRPIMAMITVAEESNNLDAVLVNIADGLDRKIARQLDIMVRLVEPMLLLTMGTVILFVLVALLLPVFEMSATVG